MPFLAAPIARVWRAREVEGWDLDINAASLCEPMHFASSRKLQHSNLGTIGSMSAQNSARWWSWHWQAFCFVPPRSLAGSLPHHSTASKQLCLIPNGENQKNAGARTRPCFGRKYGSIFATRAFD